MFPNPTARLQLIGIAALLLLMMSVGAAAEPFETLVNNGDPQNRVDIAIVGDGYTAAELQKYRNDTQTFVNAFFAQEPFREYQKYFNVQRIDVTSTGSGADHPERSVFVSTAFDATYNCQGVQRLICVDINKVRNVIANTLAPSQYDVMIVIVNDSEYGGSGGAVAVTSTHAAAPEIVLHELGHSFGLLGDEYGGPPPPDCNNTIEPGYPNVTKQTSRAAIKWGVWIDPATPIPTILAQGPGLYEGANYCNSGLYRPTVNSKMRTLGMAYDEINSEQLIKRIYNFVSPLDSSQPTQSSLTIGNQATRTFSVSIQTPLTHSLDVVWTLDGQQVATSLSYLFDGAKFVAGQHSLTVTVTDPTAQVRNDPNQVLKAQRTWNVLTSAGSASYSQIESAGTVDILVTRTGDTTVAGTINYQTSDKADGTANTADCNVNNGVASSRCDYLMKTGTLEFAPGETSKTITISLIDDSYVEGNETFVVTWGTGGIGSLATVTIIDDDSSPGPNPIDQAQSFVRQQYLDFLNREPDPSGLQFWTSQITACGSDAQCIEVKRINVSAAFFVSIEFKDTGYFVYRTYKTTYGSIGMPVPLRLVEFLPDTQQIGKGVQVLVGDWQQQLETNKQAYLTQFVKSVRFTSNYPTTMAPFQFVDKLYLNAGFAVDPNERFTPTDAERTAATGEFGIALDTSNVDARVRALRRVVENPKLAQQELNRAFVLMQYFGYLRRNPFDPPEPTLDFQGYDFWLGKLNQAHGDYIASEMVKAFISSIEYRKRF